MNHKAINQSYKPKQAKTYGGGRCDKQPWKSPIDPSILETGTRFIDEFVQAGVYLHQLIHDGCWWRANSASLGRGTNNTVSSAEAQSKSPTGGARPDWRILLDVMSSQAAWKDLEGSFEQSTPKCWKMNVNKAPCGREVGEVVLFAANMWLTMKFWKTRVCASD